MCANPNFNIMNFYGCYYNLLLVLLLLCVQNPDMPQEVLQMHLQRIIMMQIRQKQEEQRRVRFIVVRLIFFVKNLSY
jgi:hypothetical protein